ncbi:MAG: glycosyltransferase family 39 protein [Tepidisphaeraceae bacterium]|jgi:undecaprenyl-diphosphatase
MSQAALGIHATARATRAAADIWLTAARCRLALLLVVTLIAATHILYLFIDCPVDLAEDEAYYWDWSRHLDYGYYSKGPLTPALIRLSCCVFGDTMPAVRLPAIFLRAGAAICAWSLTYRLLRSPRLALGAVLLGYIAPIFLPAGLVMTTDPPFLFLWALACCVAAKAIEDDSQGKAALPHDHGRTECGPPGRIWLLVGAVVGLGFMAKFSMPVWLIGLAAFLWLGRIPRPLPRLLTTIAGFVPFAIPAILWNIRHDWVTLRHVGEDVGVVDGGFSFGNLWDLWLGQLGVVGPGLFLLMLVATGAAIRRARSTRTPPQERMAILQLLCFGLPIFLGVILTTLRQHPSASWPMASYFTLTILAAWFISRCHSDPSHWRFWRWLVYPSVITGAVLVLAAHRTDLLYPMLGRLDRAVPRLHLSVKTDPTHRLHGWQSIGQQAQEQLRRLPDGSMVLAFDYQTTAELAFYIEGHPRTWCVGSYAADPARREPFSQYDIWPDRRLDPESAAQSGLAGKSAIYLGPMLPELRAAFDRVEPLADMVAIQGGMEVRRISAWRCEGFRGLRWPGWQGRYNK